MTRAGLSIGEEPGTRERGGPLGEGAVDGIDGHVSVARMALGHHDGANANNPAVTVACVPVSVENDTVFGELA